MSLPESYAQICGDNTFGPTVPGLPECRDGFDFTDAARARTQSLIPDNDAAAGILIAIVVVKLLLVLVETKDKASILLPEFAKTSAELRSGLFSRAFFAWIVPVLYMGFKSVISSDDLPAINERIASQALATKVESRWKKRVSVGALSLMMDVLLSFPKDLCIVLLTNLLQVGLNICQPFLIQELVTFLKSPDRSINVGYGLLGGFFCVSMTNALVIPWGFHYVGRLMAMARGALVPLIYSKLLQLKGNNAHQMTAFTLVTADVETIVNDSWRLLEPWAHLLQMVIGTYLLYRQLGAVCCVPIIVILLIFTLVAVVGSKIGGHQAAWFEKIKKRIDFTSHTLSFLHPVKLLGLSRIMEEKLHNKREDELQTSQKFRVVNCSALASASAPQALAPLVTFGAYSITKMVSGQPNFTEATAVTSFSILNLILAPAMQLLLAIPIGAQAIGCYGRIQTFLQTPEDPVPSTARTSSSDVTGPSVTQKKVVEPESSVALEPIKQPCEKIEVHRDLRDLPPIRFMPNGIIAITGPSGCGKSTILRKLLASESQESGSSPSGDIAYCSQAPWIFEGTVRDNILGQSGVDNSWYQSVLHSCELRVDLDSMPNGDSTEVGSGGSKLSGGQKQRIAIARALYSKKKRAILDDVTSALDGHTMSSLITNLFSENGVVRSQGMSVVVATHSVQILRLANQVLLMNHNGQVIDSGSYEELVTRQEYFAKHQTAHSSHPSSSEEELPAIVRELETSREEYEARLQTKVDDLRRKEGDWKSFTYYLGAMGWLSFIVFVAGMAIYLVLNAIFGVWLVWWGEDTDGNRGLGYWLGLYATWAVLITLGMLVTPM
ncbi:hypothetical protein ACHAPO_009553 [Fusarium lateritium]